MADAAPVLLSTITCPQCGTKATERMPTDACWYLYECGGCGTVLRPVRGDCCVFCSYGTVPCPPVQALRRDTGCCAADPPADAEPRRARRTTPRCNAASA